MLFNSAVRPYAIYTGPYAYVAKGAALRDLGYGEIDLNWPGPSTSKLVAAYLIWSILNNSTPPATADLNGVPIVGTWTAFATPSPCWEPVYIYTFVADVTNEIINGENQITDVPSRITNGSNPWADDAVNQTDLLDDGASLIAIYETGTSVTQQVTVYSGAETTEGSPLSEDLNYSAAAGTEANTTYIVADGQLPDNSAVWNHTVVQENAFPGDDPKETSTPWTEGNLSDTKTYTVPVEKGSTNVTAEITSGEGDCLTWVGQVISLPVTPTPGPYPVTFEEQGLPAGTEWTVRIGSSSETGTATDSGSSVVFDLGNGTYDYQITPIPDYTAQYKGGIQVDGGPLFLRVAFHPALYAETFTETGLPKGAGWWVELVNGTSVVLGNFSVYVPGEIVVEVPNGSYSFFDGSYGLYRSTTPKGANTVEGPGAYGAAIVFVPPPLFAVTFEEFGLAPGTTWGGYLYTNFGDYTASTSTRTIVEQLPNATEYGDDYFDPTSVAGYAGPDEFAFEVHAAAETIDVNFSALFSVNFTETGLPTGSTWYVNLSGTDYYSYGSSSYSVSVIFSVPNGSYTFEVTHFFGYSADPISGSVTVDAASVDVAVVFTESPTYAIYFNETGLPAGTEWNVSMYLPNDQYPTYSATTPSLEVQMANGTFEFFVQAHKGYFDSPSSGSFRLHGATIQIQIRFQREFDVRFHERGLPSGYSWEAGVNESYSVSYGTTVSIAVVNGSYSYAVLSSGDFVPTPSSGSVTVDGHDVNISIVYAAPGYPTYTVTVTETGLPAGTNWTFELNYVENSTTGTSVNFTELNGSFYYYAYPAGEYVATTEYGYLTVDGASVEFTVIYSVPAYDLTFFESGLPVGTDWLVTIGESAIGSDNGTVEFVEGSGTYDYVVQSAGYVAYPTRGEVDLYDSSESVHVAFSLATFAVTFSETGLAAETEWWVNVSGGPSVAIGTPSGDTSLANGSYTYTVGTTEKTVAAARGTFSVEDGPTTVSITFAPVLFAVTFTETGLPTGSTWWVNVTGQAAQKVVGATSTVLDLVNGSYPYTASTSARPYTASGGSAKVDGAATSVTIAFHTPISSSPSFLGLPGDEGYLLVGGLGVLVALFAIFLVVARRRRKEKATPPPPGVGSSTGPGASPPSSP